MLVTEYSKTQKRIQTLFVIGIIRRLEYQYSFNKISNLQL